MTITIYHNPNCSNSRGALAVIRARGIEPVVIEYLKTPPTRAKLKELIAAIGIPARGLLREKEAPYRDLNLADPKWTDDEIVDFTVQNPVLMQRPIVVTPLGTRICRPPETVLEILAN